MDVAVGDVSSGGGTFGKLGEDGSLDAVTELDQLVVLIPRDSLWHQRSSVDPAGQLQVSPLVDVDDPFIRGEPDFAFDDPDLKHFLHGFWMRVHLTLIETCVVHSRL